MVFIVSIRGSDMQGLTPTGRQRSPRSRKRVECPKGMGYCAKCDTYKDASCFSKGKDTHTGLHVYCKTCVNEYTRRYAERSRNHSRSKRYGLTPDEYAALHKAQGGVCAICGQPETRIHKGVKVDLCVDHDHDTGEVRGLLCGMCNYGVGHFRDDVALLQKAIDYLNRSTLDTGNSRK